VTRAPGSYKGSYKGSCKGLCEGSCEEKFFLALTQHGRSFSVILDLQRSALHRAGFFRAAFDPTYASALDKNRSAADRAAFSDRLEQGLVRRVASNPAEMRLVAGVVVLAKSCA
jgi:hypothetical protein